MHSQKPIEYMPAQILCNSFQYYQIAAIINFFIETRLQDTIGKIAKYRWLG